jgi:hypothetical protein
LQPAGILIYWLASVRINQQTRIQYYQLATYPASGAVAQSGAAFGQGSGGVFLDNIICDGFERRLVDCASNPPVSSNCPQTRDAGVVCQPISTREFTELVSVNER